MATVEAFDRARYRGSLLGLAAGDALGTTVEFQPPGSFESLTDIVGGGPFRLRPGEWTDDTSMALCLAESLTEYEEFDLVDQLERYLRWWRDGHLSSNGACFDIGNTVRAALRRFEETRDPHSGSTDPYAAGNGSLMRLAPVALRYARDPRLAVERAGESSRSTHGAVAAVDACRFFAGLLVAALRGVSKRELLEPRYEPAIGIWEDDPLVPEVDEVASGSYARRDPPDIQGTGYVVPSLEAALWALYGTNDFRAGALAAANLGNDADTTAAIYGQLAGAIYGEEGIPTEWRERLALRETIESFADRLWALGQE